MYLKVLRSHKFMDRFSTDFKCSLCKDMKEITFSSKETILRPQNSLTMNDLHKPKLYFIQEGAVQFQFKGRVMREIGEGQSFGMYEFFTSSSSPNSQVDLEIVSQGFSRLYVIGEDEFKRSLQ